MEKIHKSATKASAGTVFINQILVKEVQLLTVYFEFSTCLKRFMIVYF